MRKSDIVVLYINPESAVVCICRTFRLRGAGHEVVSILLQPDVVCRACPAANGCAAARGSSVASKSLTQPDGGEGFSGSATGYLATGPREEAALPRQGTANARGDEQQPSQAGLVGRVCNTRQSPLSILGQAGILGARVRKVVGLTPGDPLCVPVGTEQTER
jgi:hypothetical protein